MVEYRCYQPLLGFCALLALCISRLPWDRRHTAYRSTILPLVLLVTIFFILSTYVYASRARNTVWQNEYTLWHDAVFKSPEKDRTVNAFAWTLVSDKEYFHPRLGLRLAIVSIFSPYLHHQTIYKGISINWYMWDTLCQAYFANGQREKAVTLSQKILEHAKNHPYWQQSYEFFKMRYEHYRHDPIPSWEPKKSMPSLPENLKALIR